jgi:hypothetical protein
VPRISEFLGLILYMYVDDHPPPHFHVIYGRFEAAVNVETGRVIRGSLPKRASRLVREWTQLYCNELLENWRLAEAHRPLQWIPPLE